MPLVKRLLLFITIMTTLSTSIPSPATEARFYVGTYTSNSSSKGIYTGAINTATGKLSPLKAVAETKNPSFVACSRDGKFLYAAKEDGGGAIAAYRIETGGALTPLNEQSSGGAGCCHVWVDATGRNVFAANYAAGSVACIRTKPDGPLSERTALVAFTGSGPNPERQQKSYGHSIYSDPTNRFVYCCDLGSDSIWIFKLDAATGTLAPNDPPAAKVPAGSGPRHLAFSAGGDFLYVCNEMGNSVTAFARNASTGTLTALDTLSNLPEGADSEAFTAAEICTHPSGKWLYVSNRDISNKGRDSFAVYSISKDGRVALVEITPAHVKIPRGVDIDPTGNWLIAAGQEDHRLVVFKIDPSSGRLTLTDQSAEVPAPVCVLFAPPEGVH